MTGCSASKAGIDRLQGGAGIDTLSGGVGDDILLGQDVDDTLAGDAGADELQGNAGADTLEGGAGDDTLFGGDGNDTLAGGTGDDTLQCGAGDDAYTFGYGDGADTVSDAGGAFDRVELGAGITAAEVELTASGDDVELSLLRDRLTLAGWALAPNRIESIAFADGAVWDTAAIEARLPDSLELAPGTVTNGDAGDTTYRFSDTATDGFAFTLNDAGGRRDRLVFNAPGTLLEGSTRAGADLLLEVRINGFYTDTGHIESIEFPGGALNGPSSATRCG